MKYPRLVVPETDKGVEKTLRAIYSVLGFVLPDSYHFTWMRRQRVALLLDDISAAYDITQTSSPLFSVFTCRRHLGIVLITCCVHTYTSIYSNFRQQLNCICLHQGIRPEHIKLCFDDICSLQAPSFGPEQWVHLYKSQMGLLIENYDDRKKYRYNFILVETYPDP